MRVAGGCGLGIFELAVAKHDRWATHAACTAGVHCVRRRDQPARTTPSLFESRAWRRTRKLSSAPRYCSLPRGPTTVAQNSKSGARHAPPSLVPTPASSTSLARSISASGLIGNVEAANMAAASTSPLIRQRTWPLREAPWLAGPSARGCVSRALRPPTSEIASIFAALQVGCAQVSKSRRVGVLVVLGGMGAS